MSDLPYTSQAAKDEHDSAAPETKKVSLYGWDSNSLQKVKIAANLDGSLSSSTEAVQLQENSGDSNIEYVGLAAIGSATSAAVWQVQKIDCNTGTVVTWADGDNNYNNIYDNRESLSYS